MVIATDAPRPRRTLVELEYLPVPVWLENWVGVAEECNRLRRRGVSDLRTLLAEDMDLLRTLVDRIRVVGVNRRAAEFVGAAEEEDLLGRIPVALLTEEALHSLADQVLVIWEGGRELIRDLNAADIGGADLACRLHWAAPVTAGKPDYSQVVVAIVDTQAYRAAELEMVRLVEEVGVHIEDERRTREHVRRLEYLIEMSRNLVATFESSTVAQLAVDILRKVVGGDHVVLHIFDHESRSVRSIGDLDEAGDLLGGTSYDDVMSGFCGSIVESGKVETTSVVGRTRTGASSGLLAQGSAAGAPIIIDNRVAGTVVVLRSDDSDFSELDVSLMRMIAAQAAEGIRNADLYEELRASHDATKRANADLKETQAQLVQAQKLEAIGSLAAGIAHEINTPIQFISDNASFLADSLASLSAALAQYPDLLDRASREEDLRDQAAAMLALWEDKDCSFLIDEMPDAIAETLEGIHRVGEIVRAMKDFAHPESGTKGLVDINKVIRTTAAVSRNEWKYVAEMQLDLDEEIPEIPALAGPLGQCLLVMFVNSAQAMKGQKESGGLDKGRIVVTTSQTADYIEIRVADNGPGIPEDIRHRVFDPFFTTKDVGEGSGQGLSIARSIIVDKHQGEVWLDDNCPGAVFVVRLPSKP